MCCLCNPGLWQDKASGPFGTAWRLHFSAAGIYRVLRAAYGRRIGVERGDPRLRRCVTIRRHIIRRRVRPEQRQVQGAGLSQMDRMCFAPGVGGWAAACDLIIITENSLHYRFGTFLLVREAVSQLVLTLKIVVHFGFIGLFAVLCG